MVASGSSSTAPRYLSALFHSGTLAGLSDRELLERFAARRGENDETAELAFADTPGSARRDGPAGLPRGARRPARGRGCLPGDVPGPGKPGGVDPAGWFGRVVVARSGVASVGPCGGRERHGGDAMRGGVPR